MFHQFNNFTGRLVGSTATQPYYPISVTPLSKADPPKIVFDNPHVKMANVAVPSRTAATDKTGLPPKLLEKMKRFQKPDGIPVYLKGGPSDRVLFIVTCVICAAGVFETFRFIYSNAFPQKN